MYDVFFVIRDENSMQNKRQRQTTRSTREMIRGNIITWFWLAKQKSWWRCLILYLFPTLWMARGFKPMMLLSPFSYWQVPFQWSGKHQLCYDPTSNVANKWVYNFASFPLHITRRISWVKPSMEKHQPHFVYILVLFWDDEFVGQWMLMSMSFWKFNGVTCKERE